MEQEITSERVSLSIKKKKFMKNYLIKLLGLDIIIERLNEIEKKYRKLEEGIMHDDYPKCIPPKCASFTICKHGRTTITGNTEANNESSLTTKG